MAYVHNMGKNVSEETGLEKLAFSWDLDGKIVTSLTEPGILTITLNVPDRLNALTRPMLHQLGDIFDKASVDPDVRVIVLTGNGRGFCSGADAGSLEASTQQSTAERYLSASKLRFTPRQCNIFKPSICAVNGVCAGAGLHFVADMDISIASENASFTDTHVNVGQVTAMEPIALSRRMPLGAVLRMVTLGKAERLSAAKALELNMISEVVPADQLMDRALELAHIIANNSPAAVQTSLKAIWESYEPQLKHAADRGLEMLMNHRDHPDAAEGPRAFLEKREPKWTTR